MSLKLKDFLAELDQCADRIPLAELQKRLDELELEMEEVRSFVRFRRERYQRNLLHAGPAYHALILCWHHGQRSPIHDHRGSNCGVKILQGVATETLFERSAEGLVYATHSRELTTGLTTASYDADIHQISNLQPFDSDLVTLHTYSPPLMVMGTYSLTNDATEDFVDPIFEFSMGSGI